MDISLRARLTFIYSLLMGTILLVFGVAAYAVVNNVLLSRVDDALSDVSGKFISIAQMNFIREVKFVSAPSNMEADVSVQIWGLDEELQDSFGPLGRNRLPFDPFNRRAIRPVFQETNLGGLNLRVRRPAS